MFTPTAIYAKPAVAAGPPPAPGPVLTDLLQWYDITNASSYPGSGTTVTDLSSAGNNATTNMAPTYNAGPPAYFNIPQNGGYGMSNSVVYSAATAEIWTYIISSTQTFARIWGSESFDFDFALQNTDQIRIFMGGNPLGWIATGYTYTNKNQWAQVVFAADTNGGDIYVNGALAATNASWFKPAGTTSGINWGGVFGSNAENVAQRIGLTRLYNAKLSATDILQNYNASKDIFGL